MNHPYPDPSAFMNPVVYRKSFFGLTEIEDNEVTLVFADPPYGISSSFTLDNSIIGYSPSKGAWDEVSQEYVKLCAVNLVQGARRVLLPGGSLVVSGVFGSLIHVWQEALKHGLKFKHHIVWHKTNPAPSVHRRSLVYSNEIILWFVKPGAPWVFNYEIAKEYNRGKQLHDVWSIPAVRKEGGVTRKPPMLLDRIIRILSNEGDIVVDPFLGSGTTGEVATSLSRYFVGYEVQSSLWSLLDRKGFILL